MSALLPLVIAGIASGSVYGLAGMGLVLTYRATGVFLFAYGTMSAAQWQAYADWMTRTHLTSTHVDARSAMTTALLSSG